MEGRHGGLARPSNVIEAKTESSQGSHSAPFPRAIPEFFIKAFSDAGDAVFDPFAGSGSTLVACEKTHRQARLIELEPKYCDVIIRRFEEFSGKRAVLESDGRGFDEIALERGAVAA